MFKNDALLECRGKVGGRGVKKGVFLGLGLDLCFGCCC